MRVVIDTNIVVAGLFWKGPPRAVLDAARSGTIELFSSGVLLDELNDVLGREKFAKRLMAVGLTAQELVSGYEALIQSIDPPVIDPVIPEDPDDDAVLACALAAGARAFVSGDRHLLDLKHYRNIPILKAAEFIHQLQNPSTP